MKTPRSRTFRIVRALGITLVALFAFYLLVGNVLLRTRLLRDIVSADPDMLLLDYDSAYTLFPGHVNVKGLKLRFQDRNIQFALKLAF